MSRLFWFVMGSHVLAAVLVGVLAPWYQRVDDMLAAYEGRHKKKNG